MLYDYNEDHMFTRPFVIVNEILYYANFKLVVFSYKDNYLGPINYLLKVLVHYVN